MDGDNTTRRAIITKDIRWPNGLALDCRQDKIYWIDAKLKRLEVANLDGSRRRLLIKENIGFPFALAEFQDKLYWTDWSDRSIKVVRKHKKNRDQRIVRRTPWSPFGLKVFAKAKQPSGIVLILIYSTPVDGHNDRKIYTL